MSDERKVCHHCTKYNEMELHSKNNFRYCEELSLAFLLVVRRVLCSVCEKDMCFDMRNRLGFGFFKTTDFDI